MPEGNITPPKYPRSNSVAEFASDVFLLGQPSRAGSVTVAITGGASATTTNANPTIAGTSNAPAGSAVNVNINGHDYAATTTSGGAWSAAVTNALTNAVYTVTVTVTSADTSVSGTYTLVGTPVGSATQSLTKN